MSKKTLTGKIISNKMQKTVVVRVERLKEHHKYKRRFRVHKNYKAHAESGEYAHGDIPQYNIGDKVVIEECRPLSKDKRWKIVKKV